MKPRISVVGLGPAGPELITASSMELLQSGLPVRLRTERHPAAVVVADAISFDDVYNRSQKIEAVYPEIVEALVSEAIEMGHVVYAVPGSPLVAEATVELLRVDERVDVSIHPALSFLDLVWVSLGIDPLAVSPRLVDGRNFAIESAGERGPLLVAQCDAGWVLSNIKLAFEVDEPPTVTVMQRLGLPDERVETVLWAELDRVIDPDHLTTLWIPEVAAPVASELARVDEVARRLRQDCPWDQEQTHESLGKYLIEETYELLEAIDSAVAGEDDAADEHLIEELGDVLFQVFAHSAIAAEEGRFNIADVAQLVSDKLIARHPHVYGDVVARTADEVVATWESNKKAAKGRASIMEGIPVHLPALLQASKVLKKASGAGFELQDGDLDDSGLGGALFLVADEARKADTDPEELLRRLVAGFRDRFAKAEAMAGADGVEFSKADPTATRKYWIAAD